MPSKTKEGTSLYTQDFWREVSHAQSLGEMEEGLCEKGQVFGICLWEECLPDSSPPIWIQRHLGVLCLLTSLMLLSSKQISFLFPRNAELLHCGSLLL